MTFSWYSQKVQRAKNQFQYNGHMFSSIMDIFFLLFFLSFFFSLLGGVPKRVPYPLYSSFSSSSYEEVVWIPSSSRALICSSSRSFYASHHLFFLVYGWESSWIPYSSHSVCGTWACALELLTKVQFGSLMFYK